jgi:hypothetical protein
MTMASATAGQLPTLTAPHYFSGQLLSDVDLDALVDWTRARLSLGCRRDGFGVVSGLLLSVDPRSGHEADLIVGPGYAVSPTGEDLVVVSEQSLSLSEVKLAADEHAPKARHAVDVFISPAQVRERPQPGFEYGDEVGEPTATYSRVGERFKLTPEPVPRREDPESQAAQRFEQEFDECLRPLADFRRWREENEPNAAAIREWFRDPLMATEFRFAAYELDERSDAEMHHESTWARALFWLILHKRNSFLSGFATRDRRVRIGRVWLWADDPRPRTIVALDIRPPYRHRLRKRSLPAPAGSINVTMAIWEREMVAHLALVEAGVSCGERTRLDGVPESLDELEDALRTKLFVHPEEEVSLVVCRDRTFGRRVVSVRAEDRRPDVVVVVDEEPDGDEGGEEVYTEVPEPAVVGVAVVVQRDEEEERISLKEGEEISLGHEGARIVTDDDADEIELDSYRRHGVLRVSGDGVTLIVTSRIPLELRGDRVRRGEYALGHGDMIKIGRTEVHIELEG